MPITVYDVGHIAPLDLGGQGPFSDTLHMLKASHAEEARNLTNEQQRHLNSIYGAKAQYAPEAEKLALALKQAQLTHAKNAVANASRRERRMLFSGLGPDGKAELYRRGSILGWSPEETQANFISGVTPSQAAKEQGVDLKEQGVDLKEQGVDLGGEGGSYLATGANRKNINDAVSRAAELDYLEDQTSGDFSTYGATFGGYSPAQIKDSLFSRGDKATQEKLIRFMGARALQPEIAEARNAISGGSAGYEAMNAAREGGLGIIEVPGFTITPEIREGVQKYINEKLKGGMKARKRAMQGLKYENSEREDRFSKALQNSSLVKGIINGEEVEISPEDIEAFRAAGGRL